MALMHRRTNRDSRLNCHLQQSALCALGIIHPSSSLPLPLPRSRPPCTCAPPLRAADSFLAFLAAICPHHCADAPAHTAH